jgi:hypothetical protein
MEMLLNPITNEIIAEDMFQTVLGWETIQFIRLIDCEEVETEKGFALTGIMNGEEFKTELTSEDYFEGKCFSLVEEIEVTEEAITEELNYIEGVTVRNKNVLGLQHVEVNGNKILSFRINKQNNSITVFPYNKYFSNTEITEVSYEQFIELVESKKGGLIHEN